MLEDLGVSNIFTCLKLFNRFSITIDEAPSATKQTKQFDDTDRPICPNEAALKASPEIGVTLLLLLLFRSEVIVKNAVGQSC